MARACIAEPLVLRFASGISSVGFHKVARWLSDGGRMGVRHSRLRLRHRSLSAFTKTLCDEDASGACTGRAIGSVHERDVARRTQQAACMKGEV